MPMVLFVVFLSSFLSSKATDSSTKTTSVTPHANTSSSSPDSHQHQHTHHHHLLSTLAASATSKPFKNHKVKYAVQYKVACFSLTQMILLTVVPHLQLKDNRLDALLSYIWCVRLVVNTEYCTSLVVLQVWDIGMESKTTPNPRIIRGFYSYTFMESSHTYREDIHTFMGAIQFCSCFSV